MQGKKCKHNVRCPPSSVAGPTWSAGGLGQSDGTEGYRRRGALSKGASVGRQNSKRKTKPVAKMMTWTGQ